MEESPVKDRHTRLNPVDIAHVSCCKSYISHSGICDNDNNLITVITV